MANYYVTPNDDNTWDVRRENDERASIIDNTQREAERQAKEFASNSGGGEVRIQGTDRRFSDSDTVKPANDPFPPRDKVH